MEIGAQLFTVHDFCKDLEGFSESLKKIADIGYKTVQVSGTCAYEPEWLKKELEKNGLRCVLTHNPAERLIEDAAKVAAENDVFGCKYVGLGWFSFNKAEGSPYDEFISKYKPVGSALRKCGKYFMYHNHDGEFRKIDGKTIIEKLSEDISPEDMGFTVDTFWVQVGGGDPAYWIEKLSGRVPCIHLKDYSWGRLMSPVGEGNINFDRIFEKARDAGTEYMLVEQDDCNGQDPFDCLKRSYDFLKSRGFN